jgi:hypothetical protein
MNNPGDSMLLVQDYLKNHSLEDLKAEYFIKYKRHTKYANLVLLKYDQLNSDLSLDICQECRSLILDENTGWHAVCFPYKKFFNYGEDTKIPNIDWKSASVQEKCDGSYCGLYQYNGEWHVSSSGVPDGETSVGEFPFTFRELFWKVWKELGYNLEPLSPYHVYMFELMTPYNQVVVNITKNRLALHGIRNMNTMQEENAQYWAKFYGFDSPTVFPFASLQDAIAATKAIKPTDGEGFVVCDKNFNRIKIKSEDYVRASHMKDSVGASMRSVIEVFQKNEVSEVLAYLPQYKGLFDEVAQRYVNLEVEVQLIYDDAKILDTQKDFALAVIKYPFSSVLFGIRNGKFQSVDDGLRNLNPDALMKLLRFKLEEIVKWTIGV